VRVQHRPGQRRLAEDRGPRPDPPAQDQPRPHRRNLRDPQRGRRPGPGKHGPAADPGPHQERTHSKTPCAREAAQGPRPTRYPHPHQGAAGWQASGGADPHAPDPPQPAVSTAAGTEHNRHPHPASAGRGQTRGRLPPPRPHHPHPGTAVAESPSRTIPNTRDHPGNPSRLETLPFSSAVIARRAEHLLNLESAEVPHAPQPEPAADGVLPRPRRTRIPAPAPPGRATPTRNRAWCVSGSGYVAADWGARG
jgi:hypothetical protein